MLGNYNVCILWKVIYMFFYCTNHRVVVSLSILSCSILHIFYQSWSCSIHYVIRNFTHLLEQSYYPKAWINTCCIQSNSFLFLCTYIGTIRLQNLPQNPQLMNVTTIALRKCVNPLVVAAWQASHPTRDCWPNWTLQEILILVIAKREIFCGGAQNSRWVWFDEHRYQQMEPNFSLYHANWDFSLHLEWAYVQVKVASIFS